jgi:hypothetical protein
LEVHFRAKLAHPREEKQKKTGPKPGCFLKRHTCIAVYREDAEERHATLFQSVAKPAPASD